jgi:5-methylcytosine-specific restriction endonuclease McrA
MPYTYPFSGAGDNLKRAVFSKGATISGYDSHVWRRDIAGHAMKYSDHGAIGDYGWEIDHIKPTAKGGSDDLSNLQPLWWQNNRSKGDTYPWKP